MTLDLTPVLDDVIDWRVKAFPVDVEGAGTRIGDVASKGWNALNGDLTFPVVVLRGDTLRANIELMARWCRKRGVDLAPHVKTPLAPQIAEQQLAAGAWGLSVATIHQAVVMRKVGAGRILLANQLLDEGALRWVAAELDRDPTFEFACLVDSNAGVRLMDERLEACGFHGRVAVLVEVGAPGGRCGCRSVEEAATVAQAVKSSHGLRLIGVEVYENVFSTDDLGSRLDLIDATLDCVRKTVVALDTRGLFSGTEVIVSGGGSLYFDRVVARLATGWAASLPVRLVLRCGSYVAQDDGAYQELSPLSGRVEPDGGESGRLEQALEAWGRVLSRPEPALAVVGLGKRDVAHDRGLPRPFAVKRLGQPLSEPDGIEVLSLNDQHARLRVEPSVQVGPGDLVGFRISHPCTTFDNWRVLPLVDDSYRVVDAIRCYL